MVDRWEQVRDAVGRQLEALLDQAGLASTRVGPAEWVVAVPRGEGERPLPVHVQIGDYTIFFTAFLIRAPRENVEEVYRFLLRRQAARTAVRFCLDVDGDLLLKGELPTAWLGTAALDWLLGSILETHEQVFWPLVRLGFASYLTTRADPPAR